MITKTRPNLRPRRFAVFAAARSVRLPVAVADWLTLMVVVVCVWLTVCMTGCNRKAYRDSADRDAYRLIKSRQTNPTWFLPDRNVEAESTSRLADPTDADWQLESSPESTRLIALRDSIRSKRCGVSDCVGCHDDQINSHWQFADMLQKRMANL